MLISPRQRLPFSTPCFSNPHLSVCGKKQSFEHCHGWILVGELFVIESLAHDVLQLRNVGASTFLPTGDKSNQEELNLHNPCSPHVFLAAVVGTFYSIGFCPTPTTNSQGPVNPFLSSNFDNSSSISCQAAAFSSSDKSSSI